MKTSLKKLFRFFTEKKVYFLAILFFLISETSNAQFMYRNFKPNCGGVSSTTVTFSTTSNTNGTTQSMIVPAGCSKVTIKAWGAGGGSSSFNTSFGGTATANEGVGTTPGNSGDADRGTSGNSGAAGANNAAGGAAPNGRVVFIFSGDPNP